MSEKRVPAKLQRNFCVIHFAENGINLGWPDNGDYIFVSFSFRRSPTRKVTEVHRRPRVPCPPVAGELLLSSSVVPFPSDEY